MNQNEESERICNPEETNGVSCCRESDCRIEALITVDERGQMVLPKDVRENANIKAGDKLALISWAQGGKILCFSLMKSEELGLFVKDKLGPVMYGLSKK
jgi:antitoxin PrlF